jgi:hypothetical protein
MATILLIDVKGEFSLYFLRDSLTRTPLYLGEVVSL